MNWTVTTGVLFVALLTLFLFTTEPIVAAAAVVMMFEFAIRLRN